MSYPPGFYKIPPLFDPIEKSLMVTEHPHSELHAGHSFVVSSIASILGGATFECVITPGDQNCHMVMHCSTSGNGIISAVYEGPSFTGGTPVTPINRNRQLNTASTATFVHTPSVTGDGTLLMTFHTDSTKQSGQSERGTEEFVLATNTSYLIRITVDAGAAATFSGVMDWYED